MKLRSRTRKSDESLQELAGDVERLARLAYPDATDDMLLGCYCPGSVP